MGHKRFRAQLPDADLRRRSQRMVGRNHKDQFVQIDDHRVQLRLLRIVGEHAEFRVVPQHIVGNVAAERALHRDLDHGMQAAELGQHRQQVERGEFVGGDHQLAFLQFAQFDQRFRAPRRAG